MTGRPHSDGRNSAETMLDRDDKLCFAWSNAPLKLSMFMYQSKHKMQWTCPFHPTLDGVPYEYELSIQQVFLSAEPCPQCQARVGGGGFDMAMPAWLYCTVFIKIHRVNRQDYELSIKIGVSL